jgi:hypothetical protein
MAAELHVTRTEADLLPVLEDLRSREPIFHRAAFAVTLEDFDRVMAPSYWEVGASGRRYSRDFILRYLAEHPPADAEASGWTCSDFNLQQLGPETYLLTYSLDQNGRVTRRSTIWRRNGAEWQILYHQGTIVSAEKNDALPPQREAMK